MIGVSWNCRGLGVALTVKVFKGICLKYKPSFVFLMETKMKRRKIEKLRRSKFSFQNATYEDLIGRAGGLALWWNDDIDIQLVSSSKKFIHTRLDSSLLKDTCYFTFVYGPPKDHLRNEVWNKIQRLIPDDGLAWIDMEFKGPRFTWSNNQLDGDHIKERLDRCFSNPRGLELYPNAKSFHCAPVGSDHSPLVLDLDFKCEKGSKVFRFDIRWLEHDDFIPKVNEGWSGEYSDDLIPMEILVNKLDKRWKILIDWSKKVFPNCRKKIDRLMRDLNRCQVGVLTEEKRLKAARVVEEIQKEWDMEEKYWLQKSRILWLKEGDKNSRFLHQSTIQRDRNKVLRLKDDGGMWMEDENLIALKFTYYFGDLFKPSGDRYLSYVAGFVKKVITEEDNERLLKNVTVDEIKNDVFNLGARKVLGPNGFSDDTLFFLRLEEANCHTMAGILEAYCLASGQTSNLDKSCLFFSKNIPDDKRDSISQASRIPCTFDPGIYLGVPAIWGRSKVASLAFVKEKMKFCEELDSLIANFLWGQKDGEGSIHWDLLKEGLCWKVGNGYSVNVWRDRWIPSINDYKLANIPTSADSDKSVDNLIVNGSWCLNSIINDISVEEANAILSIPLPKTMIEYKLMWNHAKNGQYAVKKGGIWKLKVPEKIKHFIWRLDPLSIALRRKLAAMEFLSSLQSNSSSSMTLEVNSNSLCWAPPSKGKLNINSDGAYADLGRWLELV
ncbi:reverse transcriptase [Senna tora]|uniref:Reverse transcriptase n=1 Tax=Senna tora TaxID=362788 RepID=A0A834WZ88_9FABA|nr:reverse transcriptase [Senna tora]